MLPLTTVAVFPKLAAEGYPDNVSARAQGLRSPLPPIRLCFRRSTIWCPSVKWGSVAKLVVGPAQILNALRADGHLHATMQWAQANHSAAAHGLPLLLPPSRTVSCLPLCYALPADGEVVLPQQVVGPDQLGRKIAILGEASNLQAAAQWALRAHTVVAAVPVSVAAPHSIACMLCRAMLHGAELCCAVQCCAVLCAVGSQSSHSRGCPPSESCCPTLH